MCEQLCTLYARISARSVFCVGVHVSCGSQRACVCDCVCVCAAAYLDVLLEVTLEACEEDLTLSWLESVHHTGDGALQISATEQD